MEVLNASGLTLELSCDAFPRAESQPFCSVTYEGDDAYVIQVFGSVNSEWHTLFAGGERLCFLSRAAAASYLVTVLGEGSSLGCELFHHSSRNGPQVGFYKSNDLNTIKDLLLLLRDARPA